MKQELLRRCEMFMENGNILEKASIGENPFLYAAAAGVLVSKNAAADLEKLRECKKLVKQETGVFSSFRGSVMLPVMCLLSVEADPETKMSRAAAMYNEIKKEFTSSEYLALASVILTDMVSEAEAGEYIHRGKEIFKQMKKEHPFLTGSEDSVLAVLLAFSKKSNEQLINEMEQVYEELKGDGLSKDGVQTISHVFALTDGDPLEKCAKLRKLFECIKNSGKKYDKTYSLGTMAGLALLPVEAETLVEELVEVDDYLAEQKGYGFFGFDKVTRMTHASIIVTSLYSDDTVTRSVEMGALAHTVAMIAMQQAMMCGIIAGSVAGVSAAH